jgi:hypothetical protein
MATDPEVSCWLKRFEDPLVYLCYVVTLTPGKQYSSRDLLRDPKVAARALKLATNQTAYQPRKHPSDMRKDELSEYCTQGLIPFSSLDEGDIEKDKKVVMATLECVDVIFDLNE